jgi:hypothetical protein
MVQKHSNGPIRVKRRLVSQKLGDFAHEYHDAADKVVEIGGGDSRGGHLVGHFDRILLEESWA